MPRRRGEKRSRGLSRGEKRSSERRPRGMLSTAGREPRWAAVTRPPRRAAVTRPRRLRQALLPRGCRPAHKLSGHPTHRWRRVLRHGMHASAHHGASRHRTWRRVLRHGISTSTSNSTSTSDDDKLHCAQAPHAALWSAHHGALPNQGQSLTISGNQWSAQPSAHKTSQHLKCRIIRTIVATAATRASLRPTPCPQGRTRRVSRVSRGTRFWQRGRARHPLSAMGSPGYTPRYTPRYTHPLSAMGSPGAASMASTASTAIGDHDRPHLGWQRRHEQLRPRRHEQLCSHLCSCRDRPWRRRRRLTVHSFTAHSFTAHSCTKGRRAARPSFRRRIKPMRSHPFHYQHASAHHGASRHRTRSHHYHQCQQLNRRAKSSLHTLCRPQLWPLWKL